MRLSTKSDSNIKAACRVALLIMGLCLWGFTGEAVSQNVTAERLVKADREPANWMTYYGAYNGWRYSALTQINTQNVEQLAVKWSFTMGEYQGLQVTPIVVDGVMYLASADNHVYALNAATGERLWRHTYLPKATGRINRGVAVAGNKVFLGTWDAHLIALDAKTGERQWKTWVGDFDAGHRITSPPLIVNNKAIIGYGTMEFPTRGAIVAYHVDTGERLWQFHTIPEPGEAGHETWDGKSWQYGCGPAWLPGTYDAELDLVYIGIGNPCPMYNGADRTGDNLYTNAIVALEPDTGKLKWYFQSLPHDVWDYDAVNEPVLVDTHLQGRSVRGLLQAGKNGYFYVIDRTNGKFLRANPFVPRITWTTGLDANGRPAIGNVPGSSPALICPSAFGGTSWNHMAYHPQTGYVYIPAADMCASVVTYHSRPTHGHQFRGGRAVEMDAGPNGLLVAIDVATGETKWQYKSPYPMFASVLTTAGGLVFTGDLEGNALAFDAATGKQLWHAATGAPHRGSPVTYAINGVQYIAILSGWGSVAARFLPRFFPGLPAVTRESKLVVFGLPDTDG